MCPLEILHRVYNFVYSKYEKLNRKNKEKKAITPGRLKNFYLDKNDVDFIKKYYDKHPAKKDELIQKADKLLEHKFSFFNFEDKYFGENIDWRKDYSSEKSVPLVYYCDIDYRDHKKIGDIKYIWEINRFQHFFPLAQAYCITGEEKYAKEMVSQTEDWINKNPYLFGINWTSALEPAMRIISWGWAFSLLKTCGYNISDEFKEKLGKSVCLQADYISNHLSAYSSANNHLTGEAAGLVFAGCIFDFGNYSEKLVKKGSKILNREIIKLTSREGFSREQAMGYHFFIFDLFLASFLLMKKSNINVPEKSWQILEKQAESMLCFSDDDLNLPDIGDSDDSYVLKLEDNKTLSVLNIASVLFSRGDFKYKAGENIDIKTLWLLGKDDFEKYQEIKPVKPERKSRYFEDAGYFLFKDKNTDAFIDIGNLGYLSIASHGHADALSFCLNYKNKEFLIDTGTYAFHTKKDWRDYFKGTSAHNTVEIDGQNQSEIGGNFMWLKKADVTVEKVNSNENKDCVKAYHNGYLKQGTGVKHTREVHFEKDKFVLIVDNFDCSDKKEHKFSLNWHAATECEVEKSINSIMVKNDNKKIFLHFFSNINFKTNIFNGSLNPLSGWYSGKLDQKEPVNTVNIVSKSGNNAYIATLISFDKELKAGLTDKNLLIVNYCTEKFTYDIFKK